jgi:hypothetical protein
MSTYSTWFFSTFYCELVKTNKRCKALSPRLYGNRRDALADEWGGGDTRFAKKNGNRRRQSISDDSLSPRRDCRADAHFPQNAFDANRLTTKYISEGQLVASRICRRGFDSPYDDCYEQRCDRLSTFDSQRAPSKP